MREFIHDDICEQILVRLDVKDLIRYTSVCKSWKSLISNPSFVKAHHKFRQVNLIPYPMGTIPDYFSKYGPEYYMVGSSNGLACISSFDGDEIIVANPWTREERILKKPPVSQVQSCWGFGHDSLTDDYKVVFGAMERRGKITFHVLSLKSNVWRLVGHVNCSCFGIVQIGTLCNGVLFWIVHSRNPSTKGLISFDLSKEVLKEYHQPDDAIRECSLLANKEGYVCIYYGYMVKRYWDNTGRKYYTYDQPYAFIPTTVMPSLISP